MLLSFPFHGYAAISITFSILHVFASYYFAWLVQRDHRKAFSPERLLLKAALLFMLVSTIGVWCLGPAVATMGKQSAFSLSFKNGVSMKIKYQYQNTCVFHHGGMIQEPKHSTVQRSRTIYRNQYLFRFLILDVFRYCQKIAFHFFDYLVGVIAQHSIF